MPLNPVSPHLDYTHCSALILFIKQEIHSSHPSIHPSIHSVINQPSIHNEPLHHLHPPLPPRHQTPRRPQPHYPPIPSPTHLRRRSSRSGILHALSPHRRVRIRNMYVSQLHLFPDKISLTHPPPTYHFPVQTSIQFSNYIWVCNCLTRTTIAANPLSISHISSAGGASCTLFGVDGSKTTVVGADTVDVGPPQTQVSGSCLAL